MVEANLREATFEYATLVNTDFRGTILVGASFRNSNMQKASFVGADLTGADLRGVTGLSCDQLKRASSWETTIREEECGLPIPDRPDRDIDQPPDESTALESERLISWRKSGKEKE